MPGTPVSTQPFLRSYWVGFQVFDSSHTGSTHCYAQEYLLDGDLNSASDFEKLGTAIAATDFVTKKWGARNISVVVLSARYLLTQGSNATALKFK